MIVEEEQGGKKRAQYGKAQLQELSQKLTAQLGRSERDARSPMPERVVPPFKRRYLPSTGF
ncbi:MAG: hypothetical protein J6334_01650 [Kiritimatiellae bacterium]|nr:hypothetical protein [Kiritimatiellia bacterium]